MSNLHHFSRLVPISILAASAVMAQAQISNVTGSVSYNNVEQAFDTGTSSIFGNDQQTASSGFTPTGLSSPDTNDNFTNPINGTTGSIGVGSFAFGQINGNNSEEVLTGSGTAVTQAYSYDPYSVYVGSGMAEDSLSLHLASAGSVNLDLYNTTGSGAADNYNYTGYSFDIDGVNIGTYSGDANVSQALTAGDHTFDVFVYSQAAAGGFEPVAGFQNAFADYNLIVTARVVPEPAPFCALGLGVAALALRRRKPSGPSPIFRRCSEC